MAEPIRDAGLITVLNRCPVQNSLGAVLAITKTHVPSPAVRQALDTPDINGAAPCLALVSTLSTLAVPAIGASRKVIIDDATWPTIAMFGTQNRDLQGCPVGRPAILWTTPLVPQRGRGKHPGGHEASHTLRQVTQETTEKAPLVPQREAASHSGHCDKMRPFRLG